MDVLSMRATLMTYGEWAHSLFKGTNFSLSFRTAYASLAFLALQAHSIFLAASVRRIPDCFFLLSKKNTEKEFPFMFDLAYHRRVKNFIVNSMCGTEVTWTSEHEDHLLKRSKDIVGKEVRLTQYKENISDSDMLSLWAMRDKALFGQYVLIAYIGYFWPEHYDSVVERFERDAKSRGVGSIMTVNKK